MKNKTIVIVAGGDLSLTLLPDIRKGDYSIGADYGAYWLLSHGVVPDEAIGDFDSVTTEQMQLITECVPMVSTYPKEKDYTDLELALERAIELKPNEIVIYGATGGRLDHTLGACYLLEEHSNLGVLIRCVDERSEIQIVKKQVNLKKEKKYKYYSLLPISDFVKVTVQGFMYPLQKGLLKRGKSIGISNELIGVKSIIVVHEGILFLIKSN